MFGCALLLSEFTDVVLLNADISEMPYRHNVFLPLFPHEIVSHPAANCLSKQIANSCTTMGFYTNSTSDKEYTEQKAQRFVEQAKRYGRHSVSKDMDLETFGRDWFRPFWSVDRMLDSWEYFDNLKCGWRTQGLSAFPTPSTRDYQKCREGNGVSVWDDKGWWRCLFPVSPLHTKELSQNDVAQDSGHKYGLFFKDYNSLMDWNIEVRKLIKLKYKEKSEKDQTENIQQIYDDHSKDVAGIDAVAVEQPQRSGYTSSSKSVRIHTLENGDLEEITEIHERYADGSKENRKFRKIIPKDGAPIVEDLSHTEKSGWLWSK